MTNSGIPWTLQTASILLAVSVTATAQFTAAPGSPFPTKMNPTSIAVGDFNGDLIPDLAIANANSNSVTVLLGNGTGGFTEATGSPFMVGTNPTALVAQDFDKDGNLDLAVANLNSGDVTLLRGLGTGAFLPGSSFKAGNFPSALAAGVFFNKNGDQNLGLAVANKGDNSITILRGDGKGGFTQPTGPFQLGAGEKGPSSIAVGYFDADGNLDLAVANLNSGNVTVLLGDGMGGFNSRPTGSPFQVFPVVPQAPLPLPVSVVAAKFNGDDILDLAIANEGSNNVSVLLGDGNGGFTQAVGSPFAVGLEPVSVAAADFNKDGNQDLAVVNYRDGTVTILLGNGNIATARPGTLQFTALTGSPFPVGSLPHFVALGDFNLDGRPDLAVANAGANNVTVLLNNIYSPAMVSAVGGVAPAPVAPGSIVSIYGAGLGTAATSATTIPLPLSLGTTAVTFTDSKRLQISLPLFFAGPSQVNALIPQTAAAGLASFTVFNGSTIQTGSVTLIPIAPGLFSANQTGKGVAAGQFVTTLPTGFQNIVNTFQCAGGPATCIAVPLDVVSMGGGVLALYGTGIRNATLPQVTVTIVSQSTGQTLFSGPPLYAGAASTPGLDQVNVTLMPSLMGSGLVSVKVSVPGTAPNVPVVSNAVTVYIQ
jgi:uncharacterized protein (TIGR03437 family)